MLEFLENVQNKKGDEKEKLKMTIDSISKTKLPNISTELSIHSLV